MAIDAELLEILACPLDKEEVKPIALSESRRTSTASALAATRAIHAFAENALWLKMALFPMALILFRNVPRSRDLALKALLIFGVFSATWGLFQYLLLARRDLEHRITGPTAD